MSAPWTQEEAELIKLLKKMDVREWIMAALCAVLVLGQIYFDLKLPDYMSDLTVLIKTEGSTVADVVRTGLPMLGCTLASAVLAVAAGFLAAKTAAGLSYRVREALFHKVAAFGQEEMLSFSVASLINRTTNDITQIQMLVAMGLQIIIKSPIMAVWAIIKIVGKSWQLSVITAGFVAAILAVMITVIVVVMPRVKRVQKLTDNVGRVARENLNGINVVHAFNAEDYQNGKFEQANGVLMNTQLFNQRAFAALMPTISLGMNALALVIYWVGAALVNNLAVTDAMARLTMFGNVVVFGTYATYVVMSLMMMVMIFMFLPSAQVSAERINEVLETDIRLREGHDSDAPETGTVEFQNVSFRYPGAGADALHDVSFRAGRGQTVAFIGATGCGKTTLVSLAARIYDATEGSVLIDGRDIRDYTFDALYDRVAYVTQKATLFSGDVESNVLFGERKEPDTDADVARALDLAQASEFVSGLPGGVNAPVSQGGANLSGGQKQRLSIARALARRPEIVIFDDSFSALDYKTDAALRRALHEELAGTTCLIVAQRIGTIRHADRILVLDDGSIVGDGTHEELLKSCSVYREIAMSQLSSEELEEA